MSNDAKKSMSRVLFELLKTRSLDKITVMEITRKAGVNRQTFYYHFTDIYALVRWSVLDIFNYALEQCTDGCLLFEKKEVVHNFLYGTMMDNKTIVLNIYRGLEEDRIRRALHEILDPELKCEIRKLCGGTLSEKDVEFAASFYTSGYAGVFIEWLGDGMDKDELERFERLFPAMKDSLLLLVDKMRNK